MFVLRLNCKDQPGIVAAVAGALSDTDCNIEESAQFHDPFSGHFFMRVVFAPLKNDSEKKFRGAFKTIAQKFSMTSHIDAS
jgi:formyltetrahydrofolate deformylase